MNIFALASTPQEAARMHCDQHLHKMILESAQMVSTVLHERGCTSPWLYKPSYPNHPCTLWTAKCIPNLNWLIALADELEVIRQELGHTYHSSSEVIKFARDYMQEEWGSSSYYHAENRIFCGPAFISMRTNISVEDKYRQAYIYKYRQWLDTRSPMSYRGRPLPNFLQPFAETICHDN